MSEEKTKVQQLKDKLLLKSVNVLEKHPELRGEIDSYAVGYKAFLDAAKTEREAVKKAIEMAEAKGFKSWVPGDVIEAGGKYYLNNRGKTVALFVIGSEPVTGGVRIAVAHVDSPRLDLKPNPMYEDSSICFLKTHYYGGIKKYQWTAIPLALHGVINLADGSIVDVCIGEDENDPVFYITDLLPHLSTDRTGGNIQGETLNIVIGTEPYIEESTDEKVKLRLLQLLHEKYGMIEADFMSAELTAVPAFKAKDVGLDRTLIAAYGHDDRVCAYPALTAILEAEKPVHTLMTILADKEETGSNGVTGMKCAFFTDIIDAIAAYGSVTSAEVRCASKCLSADVNAAYDPNYSDAYERRNSCFINNGVVVTKYTGSGGKSGSSDASAEYMGFIRRAFDSAGVIWQTGELGKVDRGGGGTVAAYIADKNIDTVDLGVAVLSMHAPYELIAKADVYMTAKGIEVFFKV